MIASKTRNWHRNTPANHRPPMNTAQAGIDCSDGMGIESRRGCKCKQATSRVWPWMDSELHRPIWEWAWVTLIQDYVDGGAQLES